VTDIAIHLDGVTRSFGGVPAVRGIDLTVARGETIALLGPNGAGKSTTIAMILGLLAPDGGRVSVYGQTPAAAMRAGLVGSMLQDSGFVANATVRELVELARALYPKPLPSKEILATAGLTELAGRRLDKLSGGESQRARFAFALAGDPDLLLLDEPTAAMDVASRQGFWAAMRRYAGAGHTVVFATHYLAEADEYADRVVVIAAGRVVADGPAADIKKVAGGRTVSLRLDGHSPSDLAALPGVHAVELAGDRVHLRTDDADATVLTLARGSGFLDLEVVPAGLDEAFLTLTAATEA
jgi:ABC-2 type transport system ATP-binding protein